MDRERYRRRSSIAEEFDTSLMYDDIEKLRERDEEAEKDQNGKLGSAGMMAFVAGAALLATSILGSFISMPVDLLAFLQNAAFPVLGFGALGYGFYKTLKLAFRQKELNFPALNVYRKTKPAPAQPKPEQTSRSRTEDTSRTRQYRRQQRQEARTYQRSARTRTQANTSTDRKILQRSRTNRVFSGVAGGVAEYMGISAALVRFAFIAGLFMAFPVMPIIPIIYFLLSIALPANYDSYQEKRPPRRSAPDPRM